MMNRRDFLRSGITGLGVVASHSSFSTDLGIASNFMNMSKSVDDYKTLVCIFLEGGADSVSLFVPTDNSEFSKYQKIRQNLSYEQSSVNLLNARNQNLDGLGLPGFIGSFSSLFNDEKLSIISNVGPLREPTTLSMIQQNKAILPPFMNSHADHQVLWQTGFVGVNERTGWGGRIVEAFNSSGAKVPSNISLKHTRRFLRGKNLDPFVISSEQIRNLDRYIDPETNADMPLRDMFNKLTNKRGNSLDKGFTNIINSTINNNKNLASELKSAANTTVSYPNSVGVINGYDQQNLGGWSGEINQLTSQLKRAAELIEIAPALGHHRQVIYVHLGMFDTHDNQSIVFPGIMKILADSMKAFQADLEARGVDDRVVTFTQSEFGRTITINSDGTDHGWGGHQFVMGTPVQGGQVIGALPEFAIGSSDIYQSSFIPQYSVEQYAVNLARWFGISDSEMSDIFPTYNRFDNVDFGLFI
jgi:uncharacterized protein (DUF1501 family)